ncbi:hypothetical protein C8A00DRAFT_16583, partial [Chaetomidium leptoderma]
KIIAKAKRYDAYVRYGRSCNSSRVPIYIYTYYLSVVTILPLTSIVDKII